jgi:hypothetical protein
MAPISTLFLGLAAIAWTVTFVGLIDSILSRFRFGLPVDVNVTIKSEQSRSTK